MAPLTHCNNTGLSEYTAFTIFAPGNIGVSDKDLSHKVILVTTRLKRNAYLNSDTLWPSSLELTHAGLCNCVTQHFLTFVGLYVVDEKAEGVGVDQD